VADPSSSIGVFLALDKIAQERRDQLHSTPDMIIVGLSCYRVMEDTGLETDDGISAHDYPERVKEGVVEHEAHSL
jgi:hypothetical protein